MKALFNNAASWRTPTVLLLLGTTYCVLNAFKPIQIDDAAYYYFARQIEKDPQNPYGFTLLWYDLPNSANDVLAPPLLPYTWALALSVCGDNPVLCKLFLLPWSLLLVCGLYALFRRFAPGWEMPLTAFTAFSPVLLPSLNLMLDVPALGLSLWAIHFFLRACDEDDYKRAVVAGLLAGLAIQTKYTGLVAPVVMVLGGILFRRWRLIPATALTTAQVFVCWELLVALNYGRSHFFNQVTEQALVPKEGGLLDRVFAIANDKVLFLPILFTLVGSIAPALIVLGLAALDLRRRGLLLAAGILVLGILAVALDYWQLGPLLQAWLQSFGHRIHFAWDFKLSDAVFFTYGVLAFAVVAMVGVQLLEPLPPATDGPLSRRSVYLTVFLLLWLALEIAFYFPLTQFPAVRRVLGLTVVATLLTGRLVAQACTRPPARRNVWAVLIGGIVLGFGYFALDFWNARAQPAAAAAASAWVQARGAQRVWYTGHWGFQYYAEHHGMQPLYVGGGPVRPGDYLVIPDEPHDRQGVQLDLPKLVQEYVVVEEDAFPLRTVVNYYGGTVALEHHDGPRLRVRIYRVIEEFEPAPVPKPAAAK